MKKLISLIIALVMLLSVCAMAEGKEISIGNFVYSDSAGTGLDLTGIEVKLAAAEKNGMVGASAAIAANGEDVVRAVVSADEGGIYLSADGISDVYALPMETIEMLINTYASEYMGEISGLEANVEEALAVIQNMVTETAAIVAGCMVPAGTEEIGGEMFEAYKISISEEQTMEIIAKLDQLAVLYPDLLAGSGYSSFVDMFEDEGVKLSFEGEICVNEKEMIYDLYVLESGDPQVNVYVSIEDTYYEDTGYNGTDIYVALYDPTIENFDDSDMGFILLTVYTDPATGEFMMVDLSIGDGEGNGDVYAALSLGGAEDEMKYFTVSTMDGSYDFTVGWKKVASVSAVNVNFSAAAEDVFADIMYLMDDNGAGSLEAELSAEGESFKLKSDINVYDTDGAWLPVIGETVDIMSVGEEQMNKLSIEAMGIVGKLISACSAASEDFAALVSELM